MERGPYSVRAVLIILLASFQSIASGPLRLQPSIQFKDAYISRDQTCQYMDIKGFYSDPGSAFVRNLTGPWTARSLPVSSGAGRATTLSLPQDPQHLKGHRRNYAIAQNKGGACYPRWDQELRRVDVEPLRDFNWAKAVTIRTGLSFGSSGVAAPTLTWTFTTQDHGSTKTCRWGSPDFTRNFRGHFECAVASQGSNMISCRQDSWAGSFTYYCNSGPFTRWVYVVDSVKLTCPAGYKLDSRQRDGNLCISTGPERSSNAPNSQGTNGSSRPNGGAAAAAAGGNDGPKELKGSFLLMADTNGDGRQECLALPDKRSRAPRMTRSNSWPTSGPDTLCGFRSIEQALRDGPAVWQVDAVPGYKDRYTLHSRAQGSDLCLVFSNKGADVRPSGQAWSESKGVSGLCGWATARQLVDNRQGVWELDPIPGTADKYMLKTSISRSPQCLLVHSGSRTPYRGLHTGLGSARGSTEYCGFANLAALLAGGKGVAMNARNNYISGVWTLVPLKQ